MDQQRFMAVLSEVAAVGQGGLQINEPGTKLSHPGVVRLQPVNAGTELAERITDGEAVGRSGWRGGLPDRH